MKNAAILLLAGLLLSSQISATIVSLPAGRVSRGISTSIEWYRQDNDQKMPVSFDELMPYLNIIKVRADTKGRSLDDLYQMTESLDYRDERLGTILAYNSALVIDPHREKNGRYVICLTAGGDYQARWLDEKSFQELAGRLGLEEVNAAPWRQSAIALPKEAAAELGIIIRDIDGVEDEPGAAGMAPGASSPGAGSSFGGTSEGSPSSWWLWAVLVAAFVVGTWVLARRRFA